MKRRLFVTAMLGLAAPARVRAQFIVHDPGSNLQRMLEFARSIQQQYQQVQLATSQLQSTARAVGSGNVGSAMGGISTYTLPGASTMTGLLGGRGTIDNSQTYLQRDRLHQPQVQDEWAIEMQRREQVTANANALIERGMRENEADIRRMQRLEQQLASTNAVVDAELLGVELSGFRERQEGHRRTLASVDTMLLTANRTDNLRQEQRQRRDAEKMTQDSAWALQSLGGNAVVARSTPGFLGY